MMLKWTDKPPTEDGWYFFRLVSVATGEPRPDITVLHINARRIAEQEKRREQAISCGRLIALNREQWAGPIQEPED